MIRKLIIVLMTLAAAGIAALWVGSCHFRHPEMQKFDVVGFVWMIPIGPADLILYGSRGIGMWGVRLANPAAPYTRRFKYVWSFGFQTYFRPGPPYGPCNDLIVTAPYWFPFIIFATHPTVAFIRGPVRRWRRRRRGLCVRCGYNLTGLPEPRCPECGRTA